MKTLVRRGVDVALVWSERYALWLWTAVAALLRLPQSTQNSTTLGKIVLQKVSLPLADLAAAGLNIADVREVRLAGAAGVSGTADGAAYVSDLSFDRPFFADQAMEDANQFLHVEKM